MLQHLPNNLRRCLDITATLSPPVSSFAFDDQNSVFALVVVDLISRPPSALS